MTPRSTPANLTDFVVDYTHHPCQWKLSTPNCRPNETRRWISWKPKIGAHRDVLECGNRVTLSVASKFTQVERVPTEDSKHFFL
jgi:hypothetical protein